MTQINVLRLCSHSLASYSIIGLTLWLTDWLADWLTADSNSSDDNVVLCTQCKYLMTEAPCNSTGPLYIKLFKKNRETTVLFGQIQFTQCNVRTDWLASKLPWLYDVTHSWSLQEEKPYSNVMFVAQWQCHSNWK